VSVLVRGGAVPLTGFAPRDGRRGRPSSFPSFARCRSAQPGEREKVYRPFGRADGPPQVQRGVLLEHVSPATHLPGPNPTLQSVNSVTPLQAETLQEPQSGLFHSTGVGSSAVARVEAFWAQVAGNQAGDAMDDAGVTGSLV
jgi:hypothetical protein